MSFGLFPALHNVVISLIMNQIEFFLTNPEFVRWVREPDKDLDTYWKNWIDANPERRKDLQSAREIVEGIHFKEIIPTAEIRDEVLAKILKESNSIEKKISEDFQKKQSLVNWIREIGQIYKVAAVLVIAMLFYLPNMLNKNEASEASASSRVPWIEKSTSHGEKLSITLPDGSRVWLNSGSRLKFPDKFSETERFMSISGEAYFEVKKDSLRPFRVESEGFVTTALGTSFNINTKNNALLKISLLTGKVTVDRNQDSDKITLIPGQEFQFDKAGNEKRVKSFNLERAIAWKEGRIIFENASLPEVVQTLEEWYGVKFSLVNAEKVKWKFSGEYQNQILDNILNSISYIEKFEYEINGKNVKLKF
ncbi:FecR family protein [Aquiflexum balticum DSM 16537]|uniref:FecR family protein n=2 Tax=Aquiflexum TaxID=280472 RepID=A0A1W2HBJ3_9BACT|nr:FecR family protein [Aquiflexum balticum DSM 16537]